MPASVTLTNKQHCAAGVSILDSDGQAFAELPSGFQASFASDNAAVADFVVGADGMNGDITSGQVGTCTITASVTFPDASVISDTLAVAVQNSAPGSINFTVGEPVDEDVAPSESSSNYR